MHSSAHFCTGGVDRYEIHTLGGGGAEGDITYEQLQVITESLVVENGYYQTSST